MNLCANRSHPKYSALAVTEISLPFTLIPLAGGVCCDSPAKPLSLTVFSLVHDSVGPRKSTLSMFETIFPIPKVCGATS